MKVRNTVLAALVALVTFAFAGKGVDYKVVKDQSKVNWRGTKVTGEHAGAINIADGKLTSDGKNILGGTFTIDMSSITVTDITDPKANGDLVGHLKSDDFFGTAKYPTSTLVLTKVTPTKTKGQYLVNGDLTIKGIKKPISFPATITHAGNQIKAKALVKVDRTKYDIKYGSGSFFDNLGDKAINNEFDLNINLVAQK
ncbi:YceI family protein [Rufibacter glacialis]|uniref:YceI family protein n=1 Tax=Rufibacter glacialis TaxID=1259555 RepID=A0A5M8QK86_9BACT|nr:YceI family protein [Rufibacter glacialis]KAA6435668.1 YceI family protein [Rufibacter glacialis]GGK65377.1 lipid-binding protein [Rufibacter glacialis]